MHGNVPIFNLCSINCPTAIGRIKFWPFTSFVITFAQYIKTLTDYENRGVIIDI